MWTVLLALGIGFACGLLPGAARWQKANRVLSTVGLFALLGGMGVELGGNADIMSSLPTIGLTSAALAGLAVLGSVLFTLPILSLFHGRDCEKEAVAKE